MPRARASAKRDEALAAFTHVGNFVSCQRFGRGHVNDTFLVEADTGKRYILQRINNAVFSDLKGVMGNILAVSAHIREIVASEGGDAERATLHFIHTNWGKRYYRDSNDDGWRMYEFVEHTIAKERVSCPKEFTACGEAFGRFQGWLSDFDAAQLIEPIPNFHNTPVRYQNLMRAVEEDVMGRAASVREEIEFAMQRAEFAHALERAYQSGELPLRVTHNDTKLNNILFDEKTQKPVCVIDLDTVIPHSLPRPWALAPQEVAMSSAVEALTIVGSPVFVLASSAVALTCRSISREPAAAAESVPRATFMPALTIESTSPVPVASFCPLTGQWTAETFLLPKRAMSSPSRWAQ